MTQSPQATAAPAEVKLGDKTYLMSPLTEGDIGSFELFLRQRALAVAKQNLDGLDPEDRKTLLEVAYAKALKMHIGSPEALEFMVTLDGAAHLTWLGLRHNHPAMTVEEVRKLLMDPKTISSAMDAVDELNGPAGGEEVAKKKIAAAVEGAMPQTSPLTVP